jgi:hypothetical protein
VKQNGKSNGMPLKFIWKILDFVPLQSKIQLLQSKLFPANFFFCILEKKILAGKKYSPN